MVDNSSAFDAITPIPPRVSSISHEIFSTALPPSSQVITIPTTYQLFTSSSPPTADDGVAGDWFQFVTPVSVRIYQKTNAATWILRSTISAGSSTGNVIGPASSSAGDISVFSDASGTIIADSGVSIASSGATATSSQVPRGDDPRMTNGRTPTAHAATHMAAGADPIRLDELKAPTDNTNLNATTSAHGLLPKLSGVASTFLDGTGNFSSPSGPTILTARTTAQFDKTASTSLANVAGLSVNLAAGATYIVEAVLFVDTDVTGRAKASLSGTATTSALRYEGQSFGVGTNEVRTRGVAFGTEVALLEGAVTDGRLQIWGSLVCSGSGTLTVQFAQISASGTSSVLTGSYLKAYKL